MKESDKKVRELYDIVEAKRKAIGKVPKREWQTNCSFNYDPAGTGVNSRNNIQTVKEPGELVKILAFLKVQKGAFEEAAKELGSKVVFKWGGFSYNEWLSDLQTQVRWIESNAKIKEFEALQKRLDAILSPELKAQFELEAITAALGND